jgi:hypothetical protein
VQLFALHWTRIEPTTACTLPPRSAQPVTRSTHEGSAALFVNTNDRLAACPPSVGGSFQSVDHFALPCAATRTSTATSAIAGSAEKLKGSRSSSRSLPLVETSTKIHPNTMRFQRPPLLIGMGAQSLALAMMLINNRCSTARERSRRALRSSASPVA